MERSNTKYTYEMKIKACEDYLSGQKSAKEIARSLGMGKRGQSTVFKWIALYRSGQLEALRPTDKNRRYSKEFKEQVVLEYLNGSSYVELQSKYGMPSKEPIRNWVSKYNNHIELEDYNPHPEVYMAERKKTTFEEKLEIVKYCIEHNDDYSGTAAEFGCRYEQVYAWVKKYKANGDEGLKDRRGHHKQEEELTETERQARRIRDLEHQLMMKEREIEILKKLNKLERKWWQENE